MFFNCAVRIVTVGQIKSCQKELITKLGLDSKVEFNGEILGNLRSLIEYFFRAYFDPQLDKYKKENMLEIFRSKADLEKTLLAEKEYNRSGIIVITTSRERVELFRV